VVVVFPGIGSNRFAEMRSASWRVVPVNEAVERNDNPGVKFRRIMKVEISRGG